MRVLQANIMVIVKVYRTDSGSDYFKHELSFWQNVSLSVFQKPQLLNEVGHVNAFGMVHWDLVFTCIKIVIVLINMW